MKKLLIVVAAALGLAALAVGPALAGTDTTTFQVTANVIPSCKFTAATPMQFGNLDVPTAQLNGNVNATSTISVLCTAGGSYSIDLDNGLHVGASGQRQMQRDGNTDTLAYEIFQDAARQNLWKAGTGQNVPFTGDGLADSFTAYGQLPWNESLLPSAPVGSYSDTITATVNY